MRRREFIALLGSAAALRWREVRADRLYRIGYLGLASAAAQTSRMNAFRAELAALGYSEGKNVIIEERRVEGQQYDQLPTLVKQLIDLKVDVIVTHGGPGVMAAAQATTTIPIVIAAVGDAVTAGVVSSLAHPGGNLTGITFFGPEIASKRLELLKDAIPGLSLAGVLTNPTNLMREPVLAAMGPTAQSLEVELSEFQVRDPADLESAFSTMASKQLGALVITEDPMLIYHDEAVAKLALKYRSGFPEFAQAGGLVGYGVDFVEMWRQAATFVDKILKGTTPADIPVEQPTRFVTIVNLKTARTFGIPIPSTLFARADEVIE